MPDCCVYVMVFGGNTILRHVNPTLLEAVTRGADQFPTLPCRLHAPLVAASLPLVALRHPQIKKKLVKEKTKLQPGGSHMDPETGRLVGVTGATNELTATGLYAQYTGPVKFEGSHHLDAEDRAVYNHHKPNLAKSQAKRIHHERKRDEAGLHIHGFKAEDWQQHRTTVQTDMLTSYGEKVARDQEATMNIDSDVLKADTDRLTYLLANIKSLLQDKEAEVLRGQEALKSKAMIRSFKLKTKTKNQINELNAAKNKLVAEQVAIENELMHRKAEIHMREDNQVQKYRQQQADLAQTHAKTLQEEQEAWQEAQRRHAIVHGKGVRQAHAVRLFGTAQRNARGRRLLAPY
mmetsp:Transcript_13194/g.37176  ORF Transcript_13194/g.37176 Transcript_13194/m.37176 type:complete len:348 (-) Transcript_13194:1712-2755(-)